MDPFIAFRSAAFAVFRPPHLRRATLITSGSRRVLLHTTRPPLASNWHRKEVGFAFGKKEQQFIPKHIPKPKPQRGRKIKAEYVHFRDPETRELGPLRRTQEILESVDEETHYVELVEENPPVVKIVDIQEARAATLMNRLSGKQTTHNHKEAQLSWTMAEADEVHKLGRVREDLEKGCRVDVVYQPKKGQRKMTQEEMKTKLQAVAEGFEDVSKQWKGMELHRGQGMLFLQSKIRVTKPSRDELKKSVPKLQELRKLRAEKHGKAKVMNKETE